MNRIASTMVWLAAAMAVNFQASAQKGDPSVTQPAQDSLAQQLDKAFQAVGKGNFDLLAELSSRSKELLPLLPRYVKDPRVEVRREVVTLLKTADDKRAIPLLAAILADADEQIVQEAAAVLYDQYHPEQFPDPASAAKALAAAVAAGNTSSASVLLLLGCLPGRDSIAALKKAQQEQADNPTKLHEWTTAVHVPLAADVALSRLGDAEGRRRLLEAAAGDDLETLRFLLAVLRDVDAPEALHAVAHALDDKRPTGSNAPAGADSPRRLCDDAVDAFVARLKLKASFPLNDAQAYSDAQIAEIRRKIREAIPQ